VIEVPTVKEATSRGDATSKTNVVSLIEDSSRRESSKRDTAIPILTESPSLDQEVSSLVTIENPSLGHKPISGRNTTSPIMVENSPSPSQAAEVISVEEEDLVSPSPLPQAWMENLDDYRTCPVCGMSNIPSAIINIHVTMCLDMDEEGRTVD